MFIGVSGNAPFSGDILETYILAYPLPWLVAIRSKVRAPMNSGGMSSRMSSPCRWSIGRSHHFGSRRHSNHQIKGVRGAYKRIEYAEQRHQIFLVAELATKESIMHYDTVRDRGSCSGMLATTRTNSSVLPPLSLLR
jgi:hypothetical protein